MKMREIISLKSADSIQQAINSITSQGIVEFHFEEGVYREKFIIDKPHLRFIGKSSGKVIFDWDDANGTVNRENPKETYGTGGSASVTITSEAHDLYCENITFSNSFDYIGSSLANKQAVALKNDGDRSIFKNCSFIGNQDTLYANAGRQYYKNCYIEGNVDFIFGGAQAYFENCRIFSKDRDMYEISGYIAAPSTKERKEFGFIFNHCEFVGDAKESSIYLGRPWHPGKASGYNPYALFLNSYLGRHIKEEGWASMSGFSPDDARFFEFNNYGEGANYHPKRRVLEKEEGDKDFISLNFYILADF